MVEVETQVHLNGLLGVEVVQEALEEMLHLIQEEMLAQV